MAKRSWREDLVRATCGAVVALLPLAAGAAANVPPRPARYATDLAGVVDASRLAALNERLAQFERETSNQILVWVDRRVPPGTTLEEFANAAFDAWGVGQKDKSNGVVVFVFVDDRKVRFEVGYGLEGAIPDARTVRIREDYLTPRFRAGDYAGGLEQAADQLMKAARGEPYQGTGRTAAETPPSGPLPWWVWLIPVIGAAAGWRAARNADDATALLLRGGGVFVFVTGFLSMVASPLTGDVRPMVVGFGVVLLGLAVFVAWMIGRDVSLGGRRRVGHGLLQAGAGLMVGGLGLLCLSAVRESLAGWGGRALLYGLLALIVGGFVRAQEPLRTLTVAFARLAFAILMLSSIFLAVILIAGTVGAQVAIDWVVVSGLVWLMLWIFARSRGWELISKPDPVSATYSSGGRSSGSSWSSSGSSSWSSSSSSGGSSFSGGGGRSGGGGSSGSW
jgi:uncharacterized protein